MPWIRALVVWLVLTVGFEFTFGYWVAGHSWSRLLADYNVARGRLWVVILFVTLLGPWLASHVPRRRAAT